MVKTLVNVRTMFAAGAFGLLGLVAAPRAASAQVPDGSYQKSCRAESVSRDGTLHAQCRDTFGKYHDTSIRPADCRRGDIANGNGSLTCVNQRDDRRDNHAYNDDDDNDNDNHNRNGHGNNGKHYGWYKHGDDQRGRDRSMIILYADKRFNGRTMNIRQDYTNLGNTGFNDVASSLRVVGGGTWRVCSDKEYGGRCVNVTGDVSDLSRIGLQNNISSVRQVN